MTRKKLCTSLNMDATSTQVSYEALSIPKFLIHFPLFSFFFFLICDCIMSKLFTLNGIDM